jgi:hypothetical protein
MKKESRSLSDDAKTNSLQLRGGSRNSPRLLDSSWKSAARVCVREREFSRLFTLPYELVKTPTHQTPKLLLPY